MRTGPRPVAIRAFAISYLALAVGNLVVSLLTLDEARAALQLRLPGFEVSRDLAIVLLSAKATIAAITLFLVWFLAARIARWLLGVVAAINLWSVAMQITSILAGDIAALPTLLLRIAVIGSIACLFLSGARQWFEEPGERDAPTFD